LGQAAGITAATITFHATHHNRNGAKARRREGRPMEFFAPSRHRVIAIVVVE
jgi:hypothetical protein